MRQRHVALANALHVASLKEKREKKPAQLTDGMNRKKRREFETKKKEAMRKILKLARKQLKEHPLEKGTTSSSPKDSVE